MNVFVQPHLDDVAWSCGGTVSLLGARAEAAGEAPCTILTVFDRSPDPTRSLSLFARMLHAAWGAGRDPLPMRRAENVRALEILGARGESLDLHEALYRDPPVHSSGALLRPPGPSLAPLAHEIAERLVASCEGAERVFLPLGIATHVDHVLCFSAHDRLREAGVAVHHYEDFPYVTRAGKLAARLESLRADPLEQLTVDVAHTLGTRIAAVRAYASQLRFMGMDRPDDLVRTHAAAVRPGGFGERFWTRDPGDLRAALR